MSLNLRFRQKGPEKIDEDLFYFCSPHPFSNKNDVRNVKKMKLFVH